MSFLASYTADGRWHPGIGDPTPLGWLTVAAYLVAAFHSWRACRATADCEEPSLRLRCFWGLLAASMLALGVNKQLDLQGLLTQVGRDVAMRDGWYRNRGIVQQAFILGLVGCALACGALALWILREHLREIWIALAGAVFTATFVVVRASSFHKVDWLLGNELAGLKVHRLLELGGVALVAFAAWDWRRRVRAA